LDGLDDLAPFIGEIAPMLAAAPAPMRLDLSDCCSIQIGAATTIAAIALLCRERGQQAEIILPTWRPELVKFCTACGLNHYLKGEPLPDADDSGSAVVRIRQLRQSRWQDPDPVIAMLRRHVALSEEYEESLRICISEVIQNVQDHAQSPIGALIAAHFDQSWAAIAVIDCGVGIATSLRQAHSHISDGAAALQQVLEGGVSAKSRPNNQGVGLNNVATIVGRQFRGLMTLFSEDAGAATSIAAGIRTIRLPSRYPGTGVILEIPFGKVLSNLKPR
jgi:hypothetical protein